MKRTEIKSSTGWNRLETAITLSFSLDGACTTRFVLYLQRRESYAITLESYTILPYSVNSGFLFL